MKLNLFRALKKLFKSVGARIVQDAPEEDAFCAFHCDKTECDQAHWEKCPRRNKHLKEHTPDI